MPPARRFSAAVLVIRGQRGPGQEPSRHHALEISSTCLLWVYFFLFTSFVPPGELCALSVSSGWVRKLITGVIRKGCELDPRAGDLRLAVLHSNPRPGSPVRELYHDISPQVASMFISNISSCLSSFFFPTLQEKETEREREGWAEMSCVQIRQHSLLTRVKGYCERVM